MVGHRRTWIFVDVRASQHKAASRIFAACPFAATPLGTTFASRVGEWHRPESEWRIGAARFMPGKSHSTDTPLSPRRNDHIADCILLCCRHLGQGADLRPKSVADNVCMCPVFRIPSHTTLFRVRCSGMDCGIVSIARLGLLDCGLSADAEGDL